MVLYDQLRISDDGQSMFIDAHVNQASYFDSVYLKKITICTEEQVSELQCVDHYKDFIYQQEITPYTETKLESLYDKPIVFSAERVLALGEDNTYGGFELLLSENTDMLSCIFSGKFATAFGINPNSTPKLVIANNNFNPNTNSLDSDNVLFKADGVLYENAEKGYTKESGIWMFKTQGDIGSYDHLYFYLYKQNGENDYEYVELNSTDDMNFLHFLYQEYSEITVINNKELHLVLTPVMMNEKFSLRDFSHNMFFVFIETAGIHALNTPCTLDEITTLGVTFDYGAFFNPAMNYTRELADTCEVSSQFMDFILNFEALKLSIETEHWIPAIGYWKNLMGGANGINYKGPKPCGCHG